ASESGELALFNRRDLHTRAADYFESIRLPEERWKTLADFAPHFEEMYHCYEASLYDRAAVVIGKEATGFLRRAGYARQLVAERQRLVDKPMNQSPQAYNLHCLANAYSDLGEQRMVLDYYEQAIEIYRHTGDRPSEGKALTSIGNRYFELGERRKALAYHEQSLKIHREIGDRDVEGMVLNNIGIAYSALGEQRKALEYFEQALEIHRDVSNRVEEGRVLGNKGIAMFNLGDKEEGIRFVEQAIEIARQVEDKMFEEFWLEQLAEMKS